MRFFGGPPPPPSSFLFFFFFPPLWFFHLPIDKMALIDTLLLVLAGWWKGTNVIDWELRRLARVLSATCCMARTTYLVVLQWSWRPTAHGATGEQLWRLAACRTSVTQGNLRRDQTGWCFCGFPWFASFCLFFFYSRSYCVIKHESKQSSGTGGLQRMQWLRHEHLLPRLMSQLLPLSPCTCGSQIQDSSLPLASALDWLAAVLLFLPSLTYAFVSTSQKTGSCHGQLQLRQPVCWDVAKRYPNKEWIRVWRCLVWDTHVRTRICVIVNCQARVQLNTFGQVRAKNTIPPSFNGRFFGLSGPCLPWPPAAHRLAYRCWP